MLFKRRDKPTVGHSMRGWLWPRQGWRRSFSYAWQRVKRLSGTPHSIALGFACGAFASFTPFMGLHFLLGFAAAAMTRGNLLASAFGTFIGNPLSFPFIWYATYTTGTVILGINGAPADGISMPSLSLWAMMTDPVAIWQDFADRILPVFLPMLIGGIPLGLAVGAICYFAVRWAVNAYKTGRSDRLEDRRMAENGGKRPPQPSRPDARPIEPPESPRRKTPEMMHRHDA